MSIRGKIRSIGVVLSGGALMLPLLTATAAQAEVIPVQRMAEGVHSTQAECAAQKYAVWVVVSRRGYCIRYYLSTAGGEGRTPIVWLSGDKIGRVDLKTRRFTILPDAQDVKTEDLQLTADNLSKQAKTTAIYLARPGLDGSSGHHSYRRSWLELYVLQAAMDAIKQRHGYAGFHLAGQSGGAGLIGGLLALREDIGCAVPGAGRLSTGHRAAREADPLLEFFDPLQGVQKVAQRRSTRIIVVTDPNDQTVPAGNQTPFVEAVQRAGGRIEQFFVEATDEKRHGVAVYTRFVVAACVRGMDYQQIAQGLAKLQERHLAAARERKERQARGPAPSQPVQPTRPAAPAPAPAPRVQPAQNPPRTQPPQAPRIQPAQAPTPRVQPAQAPRLQPTQPVLVRPGIMKTTPRVASIAPRPALPRVN